jgi:hypothetical protein
MRKLLVVTVAVLAALPLVGCGSGYSRFGPFSEDKPVDYHVGDTVTNGHWRATLVQVIDPAHGADVSVRGNRLVAVELTLTNGQRYGLMSGDATREVSVTGSDDRIYEPTDVLIAEGDDFDDGAGAYDISPGQSATGFVPFELPVAVTVTAVDYNGAGGGGWSVP